jgi:hypothetical protein
MLGLMDLVKSGSGSGQKERQWREAAATDCFNRTPLLFSRFVCL